MRKIGMEIFLFSFFAALVFTGCASTGRSGCQELMNPSYQTCRPTAIFIIANSGYITRIIIQVLMDTQTRLLGLITDTSSYRNCGSK